MKVIIAGTRRVIKGFSLYIPFYNAILEYESVIGPIFEVVCGLAPGYDSLGEEYAKYFNKPISYFPARWEENEKAAGILRNKQMGDYADGLLAFPSISKSKGTWHMIKYMQSLNKPVLIKKVP